MIKEITSKNNPIIKSVKSLQGKAGRKKSGLFFVEGLRIVQEALDTLPCDVHSVVLSQSFKKLNEKGFKKYSENFNCYLVSDSVFSEISDTETPQGVLAVLRHTPLSFNSFSFNDNRIIILDSVRDPGNIGTIIRTAEAMGFNSVFLNVGCADLYSPKVLRSTMGSVFRLNIYEAISNADIGLFKENGYTVVSTALSSTAISLKEAIIPEKAAIIIGNEANGISSDILDISDITVKIPMKGKTESLNAAVAAAITMYHFSLD